MKRKASARWEGGLKDGKGVVSTASGVLSSAKYSFTTRFEDSPGTNPEELVGAAEAGCFSMALSHQIEQAGMKPESIETTATVTLEKVTEGFQVTQVHLDVVARVPNADAAAFEKAADTARAGCPISKLLNTKITMDVKLNP
jgi:lipoyl-dependent peroxiredoxin